MSILGRLEQFTQDIIIIILFIDYKKVETFVQALTKTSEFGCSNLVN